MCVSVFSINALVMSQPVQFQEFNQTIVDVKL